MTDKAMLLVEQRDDYLWIRLNRADKANALAVAMMESATAALYEAVTDDAVRAVMLTGAGERVFCAGAETEWFGALWRGLGRGAVRFAPMLCEAGWSVLRED